MKKVFYKTALLLIALFAVSAIRAQLVYTDQSGTVITISSDKGGVCNAPTGIHINQFIYDNPGVENAFSMVPPDQYFKAKYTEPVTIIVEVRNPGGIWWNKEPFKALIGTDSPPYLYDQDNIVGTNLVEEFNQNNQLVAYRYQYAFPFPRADTKGWIILRDIYTGSFFHHFILPFVVEGTLTSEVPILGTTVQPQLPYFILHAPPGDGSTAEFQETKTVCREIVQSAAQDNSNSGYVDVKIGVAGSVGFIATVNFEFSVTVGTSVGGGEMEIKTQGNQTCLTVTEGFQTPPGGDDVFVGYGVDLAYGVSSRVAIDSSTCTAYLHPIGLVYMPVGQPRQFYYTTSEIQEQINQQQILVNDTTLSVRARNNAQNQMDVWTKVLAMNEANINNPANVQIGAVSYGTVPTSHESSITVTETSSIEYENFVDYSASLDVVVEVGGSGVSGGYEYRGSQRYGAIQNQSQEVTKIVRYALSDDDSGDLFNVDIYRDPMFGTPVFRNAAGTKSSCPYQGGYQRDQPKLKHDGTASDHITLLGHPVGSSATFKIDLCNESNEARTYNLKLNAQSNLNGAVVSAAGVPLNGNDLGQTFTVPANGCVQDLVVEVKQLSGNSPLSYPDLELFLYAVCEESIQSSVFASVYFGNASGVEDVQGVFSSLKLSPNPTADATNLDFELKEAAPVRVALMDMQGLLVKTQPLGTLNAGRQRQTLETSDLPNGMYVLTLESTLGRTYQKLVVQR